MSEQTFARVCRVAAISLVITFSACGVAGDSAPTYEKVQAAANDTSISCKDWFAMANKYYKEPLPAIVNDSSKPKIVRATAKKLLDASEDDAYNLFGESGCKAERKEWIAGRILRH